MSTDAEQKYRNRTSAEYRLDSRMHTQAVQLADTKGRVPSKAVSDIRRRRQHPWRVWARRIIEIKQAGVPLEDALSWVGEFQEWVKGDVYGDEGEAA